ncbi:histidine--tRNA ligase [Natranaerofaba carboxydovora]|uniref:histidine--tRNA ligase n=1 Tax=Natranaerofaba carboxydovora TaxID=2742683 RepID=UPI001F12CC0E|nr:histidine--tRNA ligase [Natranaerofaba carboxydovora]UMZ73246.1 Histidine--tRNA ligase [Natranaerofaba carboxydovora]
MLTKAPKGTRDILPGETSKWQYFERVVSKLAENYGFNELRVPIFEHTDLFARGVGESTDIVTKQMYTFEDKAARSITLRPEGTASTVRAFIEYKMFNQPQPVKMYYLGPMFRYENPQAGRYRQFHQFGVEYFGSIAPEADVETIQLCINIFKELGLKNLSLEINSVGCPNCRQKFQEELKKYLANNLDELCKDCRSRYETNPMRILDCKNKKCNDLLKDDMPLLLDNLCSECDEHFYNVKELLTYVGLDFEVNPKMVRGLDYYTKTAFEVIVDDIGAQSSIGGGGRYDGLVKECGGPETPAVGFAVGIERVLLALENQGVKIPEDNEADAYLVYGGSEAKKECFRMLDKIRSLGYLALMDFEDKSFRAQLKKADKLNAKYAVIIGEEELSEEHVLLRNMKDGNQEKIPMNSFLDKIQELIR